MTKVFLVSGIGARNEDQTYLVFSTRKKANAWIKSYKTAGGKTPLDLIPLEVDPVFPDESERN